MRQAVRGALDGLPNRTRYPSDAAALVVLWRLRHELSLRDLPGMFLVRGLVLSREAVREWEAKLAPALAGNLRRRRRGKAGRSWHVDGTCTKVQGRWCHLYRAIDRSGALVDAMFGERCDTAAEAFFRPAKAVTGASPERVTTDDHDSYPRAIRTQLGEGVRHRTSRYKRPWCTDQRRRTHCPRSRPASRDADGELGRPSSSSRFRARTAMATSVARRRSVRDRSVSSIARS